MIDLGRVCGSGGVKFGVVSLVRMWRVRDSECEDLGEELALMGAVIGAKGVVFTSVSEEFFLSGVGGGDGTRTETEMISEAIGSKGAACTLSVEEAGAVADDGA